MNVPEVFKGLQLLFSLVKGEFTGVSGQLLNAELYHEGFGPRKTYGP